MNLANEMSIYTRLVTRPRTRCPTSARKKLPKWGRGHVGAIAGTSMCGALVQDAWSLISRGPLLYGMGLERTRGGRADGGYVVAIIIRRQQYRGSAIWRRGGGMKRSDKITTLPTPQRSGRCRGRCSAKTTAPRLGWNAGRCFPRRVGSAALIPYLGERGSVGGETSRRGRRRADTKNTNRRKQHRQSHGQ